MPIVGGRVNRVARFDEVSDKLIGQMDRFF